MPDPELPDFFSWMRQGEASIGLGMGEVGRIEIEADAARFGPRDPAGKMPGFERVAIHAAIHAARPGDLVIVAGKGHETTQTIGNRVEPFDDRDVVTESLAQLGWSGRRGA